MSDFRVDYDEESDILHLAREGEEHEVIEVSPGVSVEYDQNGSLIGVELFHASKLLKDVLRPMERKLQPV